MYSEVTKRELLNREVPTQLPTDIDIKEHAGSLMPNRHIYEIT